MGEPLSKGTGYQTAKEAWLELLPPEEIDQIVAKLSPAARALWEKPPLAIAWVPQQDSYEFAARAVEVLGERALALSEEAARRIVHKNFNSVYKALIRLATIDFVIDRAAKLYGQYTRDCGVLTAKRTGPTGSLNRYEGVPSADPLNAWFLGGAGIGILELVGAKDVKVVRRHVDSKAKVIELDFVWA